MGMIPFYRGGSEASGDLLRDSREAIAGVALNQVL